MPISIGTFNLNNLFSRYNFQAEIAALPPHEAGGIELTFSQGDVQARTFMGRLVKAKDPSGTADIARRIREMNVDVLAVQEVEHIEILREFNRDHLGGLEASSKTWHQPGAENSDQTGLLTTVQTTLTCAIGLLAPLS